MPTPKKQSPRRSLQWLRHIVTALTALLGVLLLSLLGLIVFSQGVDPERWPLLTPLHLCFGPVLATNLAMLAWWLVWDRRILLAEAACLLPVAVAVRTYCPVNLSPAPADSAICLLSYNTYSFGYASASKSEASDSVISYLAGSKADIMCLQEAVIDGSMWCYNIYQQLHKRLPYEESAILGCGNTHRILSRWPIVEADTLLCPEGSMGAFYCRIKRGDDTITVVNVHLQSYTLDRDDKALYESFVTKPGSDGFRHTVKYFAGKVCETGTRRARQVDRLVEFVKAQGDRPVLVCGDFNSSPIGYAHHRLTSLLDDAYTRGGIGPGFSYNRHHMNFRIDHILCSRRFEPVRARVESHVGGSDHYPIVAWLNLKEKYQSSKP